jgi:hypothetical protein
MGTLFHAVEDLLTFGTIVIVAMLAGGLLVILAIIADSVWLVRERHRAHQDEDQLYLLESIPQQRHRAAQLKKTA